MTASGTASRRAPAQARHPPRRPRRVPLEGRGRGGPVRRQGQAPASRVRSYFASRLRPQPEEPAPAAADRRRRDHRRADEAQSLILENNLIKEYQPRFNVRLKDDKSYPSIAVTLHEPFPRVLVTRRRDIPGARYFGPYTDVGADAADAGAGPAASSRCGAAPTTCPRERRERPCLDYHIGRCQAPCVGWQDEAGLPRDDRRSASASSRGGPVDVRDAGSATLMLARQRRGRTSSAPRTCATRSAGSSSWRRPPSVEVMGTGDADVIGYARDGDDAVGVLFRVRDGPGRRREHRFLENARGGARRRGAERLPGPVLRRRSRTGARGVVLPVPAGGLGQRCASSLPGVRLDGPAARHRRRDGSIWPTRTPGTCWRACGSSRSRPRSGPRIRCTRWAATSDCSACRAAWSASTSPPTRGGTRWARWSGSRPAGPRRASIGSSRSRAWASRTTSPRSTKSSPAISPRRRDEGKPLPDLVVIDGGKGQLGAALEAAASRWAWRIPIDRAWPSGRRRSSCPGGASRSGCSRRSPSLRLLQRRARRGPSVRAGLQPEPADRAHDHLGAARDSRASGPKRRRRLLERFGSLAGVQVAPSVAEIADGAGLLQRARRAGARATLNADP